MLVLPLKKDMLEPYKRILDRWLWPMVLSNEDTSVSKAKQAISDYKMAVDEPEGLAELMVFYCERLRVSGELLSGSTISPIMELRSCESGLSLAFGTHRVAVKRWEPRSTLRWRNSE